MPDLTSSSAIIDPTPDELMESLSCSPEGLRLHVAGALRNAGFGPLVGGWLITRYGWEQGVRYALLGCITLSAATAVFQWFMAEPETEAASTTPNRTTTFHRLC